MLIIWGFKARSKVIASGTFFCPRDGGDRDYEHKEARRWFTFFWIPLIPLKALGDFIECTSCKSTFYPDALKAKTSDEIQDVSTIAIRHVVVSMLQADGRVDESERQAALAVVARFASRPYNVAALDHDLASLDSVNLVDSLEELGAILNEHGKESVLTAAAYLAGADGDIDDRELETAHRIGDALGMSKAHIQGTIDQEHARLGVA